MKDNWSNMMYNPKKYIPKMYKPFYRDKLRGYVFILKNNRVSFIDKSVKQLNTFIMNEI